MKSAQFSDRRPATLARFILASLLLLSLAAVFLWSGWTKIRHLEPFSWNFIDVLPVNGLTASVLARLTIGLEWLIGGCLIAQVFPRATFRLTLAVLVMFCLYLGFVIATRGNSGDCGCFGGEVEMTPLAAILKNVLMIAALVLARWIHPYSGYKGQFYPAMLIAVAAFTAPFIMEPVYISTASKTIHEPIDLTALYDGNAEPVPTVDLRNGKHVVCYFSTTCPHCKTTAVKLQELYQRYPELPLYMILNGNDKLQREFLSETNASAIPHSLMRNTPAFSKMAGPFVPTILWINNSVTERKSHFDELEPGAIKAWLRN